jgi:hypothetical protein
MPALRGGFLRFDEHAIAARRSGKKVRRPSRQDQSKYPLLKCEDSNGVSPANSATRWHSLDLQGGEDLARPVKMNSTTSAWPPLKTSLPNDDKRRNEREKPTSRPQSLQKSKLVDPKETSYEDFSLPESTDQKDNTWVQFPSSNALGSTFVEEFEQWPYTSEIQSSHRMEKYAESSHGTRSHYGSKTKQETGVRKHEDDSHAPKTSKYLSAELAVIQTMSTAPTSSQDYTTSSEMSSTRSEIDETTAAEESHTDFSSSQEELCDTSNQVIQTSQSEQSKSVGDWQGISIETREVSVSSQIDQPRFVVKAIHACPDASIASELTMDRAHQNFTSSEGLSAFRHRHSVDAVVAPLCSLESQDSMEGCGEIPNPTHFRGSQTPHKNASASQGKPQNVPSSSTLIEVPNITFVPNHGNEISTSQGHQHVSRPGASAEARREVELLQKFVEMAAPIISRGGITIAQEEPIRIAAARLGIPLESTRLESSQWSEGSVDWTHPPKISFPNEATRHEMVVGGKTTSNRIEASINRRRSIPCLSDLNLSDSAKNTPASSGKWISMTDSENDIDSKCDLTSIQTGKTSIFEKDAPENSNAATSLKSVPQSQHTSIQKPGSSDDGNYLSPTGRPPFGENTAAADGEDDMAFGENTAAVDGEDDMSIVTGFLSAEDVASDAGVAVSEPTISRSVAKDLRGQENHGKYAFVPIPEREGATVHNRKDEDIIDWPAFPEAEYQACMNFPKRDELQKKQPQKKQEQKNEGSKHSRASARRRQAVLQSVPEMGSLQYPPMAATTEFKTQSKNLDKPFLTKAPPRPSPEIKLETDQEISAIVSMESLGSLGSLISSVGSEQTDGSSVGSTAAPSCPDSKDITRRKANPEVQSVSSFTESDTMNAHSGREKPIGASMEEIEMLNCFLKVVGPHFNGTELSIIEREKIYDQALRAGLSDGFLNKILDQSAGIRLWEDRSDDASSTSSMKTGFSTLHSRRVHKRNTNTSGGSSVKTKNSVFTSSTNASFVSGLSVVTRDAATISASDAGGWTCMFNLEKHFWSDLQSQMVGTVSTVISRDSGDSIHSEDLSWVKSSDESSASIHPP